MERPSEFRPRPSSLVIPQNHTEEDQEQLKIKSRVATGQMRFPDLPDRSFTFNHSNLKDLGSIGSGNYGTVYKMLHNETERLMAVKKIRFQNITGRDQERLVREHNTIMQSSCENIVEFYGVIFHEGDCWICMELMDVSLDRLYRRVYNHLHMRIEEPQLAHIAVSTINALHYLKNELKIMHRDVKPSNILINHNGSVKLCDFGICGELENSIAKTHDVGCQPYQSPERIKHQGNGYDIRSDVWSLGISLYEISTGEFPYTNWSSPFDQITAVVHGDAPVLKVTGGKFDFSLPFVLFVNRCLTKEYKARPKYVDLMEMDFYKSYLSQTTEQKSAAMKKLGEFAQDTLEHPEILLA